MLDVFPANQHRPKALHRALKEFAYLPQNAFDLHRGVASGSTKLPLPEYARFQLVGAVLELVGDVGVAKAVGREGLLHPEAIAVLGEAGVEVNNPRIFGERQLRAA